MAKHAKDVSEDGVGLVLPVGHSVRGAAWRLGRGPHGAPPSHAAADDRQQDHLHHLRHRQDAGAQEQAHVAAQVAWKTNVGNLLFDLFSGVQEQAHLKTL